MSVADPDRYSLSSASLTRASSSHHESELLPTPLDELPRHHLNVGHQKRSSGHFERVYTTSDTARIRSGSPGRLTLPFGAIRRGVSQDLEGLRDHLGHEADAPSGESYFPFIPHDADSPLQHRRSTKELIGRFETITSAAHRVPSPIFTDSRSRREAPPPEAPVSFSPTKGKSRAPLRDSFRNLLAVFGKKGRAKDVPPILSTRYLSPHYQSPLAISSLDASVPNCTSKEDTGNQYTSSPLALRSGPILYLCPPPSANTFPVWNSCSAKLFSTHILLEWSTSHGNPATHTIPLITCTDVRSLAAAQVDATERGLLPETSSTHIFELTFDQNSPAKFASSSVFERSGWVSSIWDALLQCREPNTTPPQTSKVLSISIPPDIKSRLSTDKDDYSSDSADTQVAFEIPSAPTTPTSALQRRKAITLSWTPSPSIQKLDNLSVVKARLAQINQGDHDSPLHGSPSRRSRTRQTGSSLASPQSEHRGTARRPLAPPQLSQRMVQESISEDCHSIFDLYDNKTPRARPSSPTLGIPACLQTPLITTASLPSHWRQGCEWTPKFSDIPETPASETSAQPPFGEHSVHPLVALIQDQAAQQYSQTADLGHKIASLSDGVCDMSKDIRLLIVEQESGSTKSALEELSVKLDRTSVRDGVTAIKDKLDAIQANFPAYHGFPSGSCPADVVKLMDKLEETRLELKAGMPPVLEKLEAIERLTTMSHPIERTSEAAPVNLDTLSDIHIKLDDVLRICKVITDRYTSNEEAKRSVSENFETVVYQNLPKRKEKVGSEDETQSDDTDVTAGHSIAGLPAADTVDLESSGYEPVFSRRHANDENLSEILAHIKSDREQRNVQASQQADSIRYLHELNSWLEAFVNNGSAQMQSTADGLQQMCRELGLVDTMQDGSRQAESSTSTPSGQSLLSAVRSLLVESKERGKRTTALQLSVQELVTSVNEGLQKNSEARRALVTDVVVTTMDRQRQDQERLLRDIAAELSNDIRGERLRFVEAMKEATAINVQIHVEEFKKELSREVMNTTHEVGRLQKERQGLEKQIADLFSFISRQRGEMPRGVYGIVSQEAVTQQSQRNCSTRRSRPLPSPTRSLLRNVTASGV